MAVETLFISTKESLIEKLRMSCVSDNADTQSLLDSVIQRVRVHIFDRLGEAKVNELLAIPEEENPTTAEGNRRLKASVVECLWVKKLLLCELPVLFLSNVEANEEYDTNPATRFAGSSDLEFLMNKTCKELDDLLDDLETGEVDTTVMRVATICPDPNTVKRPFDSILS
jgi:hypothetical protein